MLLGVALAQKPARIGPDGKPLLNRPDLSECQKRRHCILPQFQYFLKFIINLFLTGISHLQWQGHNYFMSWREPWHKFEDWDWFNGRNFCRDRCMDLVSFDTPGEYELFAAIMKQGRRNIFYVLAVL